MSLAYLHRHPLRRELAGFLVVGCAAALTHLTVVTILVEAFGWAALLANVLGTDSEEVLTRLKSSRAFCCMSRRLAAMAARRALRYGKTKGNGRLPRARPDLPRPCASRCRWAAAWVLIACACCPKRASAPASSCKASSGTRSTASRSPSRGASARWLATRGVTWVYDRATDLVPSLTAMAVTEWWSGMTGAVDRFEAEVRREVAQAIDELPRHQTALHARSCPTTRRLRHPPAIDRLVAADRGAHPTAHRDPVR